MRFFFLLFSIFVSLSLSAQKNSPYEVQRKKINNLLSQRSAKFGQYEKSLSMKTGIFGWKTKKDMQRSIDILTEVFKTDNTIFRELKILLEYKDLEKNQAQTQAYETQSRIKGYMQTIAKLQQENERLKAEIGKKETEKPDFPYGIIAVVISILALLVFLFRKN
jgi:hypothetical protein